MIICPLLDALAQGNIGHQQDWRHQGLTGTGAPGAAVRKPPLYKTPLIPAMQHGSHAWSALPEYNFGLTCAMQIEGIESPHDQDHPVQPWDRPPLHEPPGVSALQPMSCMQG